MLLPGLSVSSVSKLELSQDLPNVVTGLLLPQGGALVHVYTDGSVLLTHGGTEMGQGLHTKMVQVSSLGTAFGMSGVQKSAGLRCTRRRSRPESAFAHGPGPVFSPLICAKGLTRQSPRMFPLPTSWAWSSSSV